MGFVSIGYLLDKFIADLIKKFEHQLYLPYCLKAEWTEKIS